MLGWFFNMNHIFALAASIIPFPLSYRRPKSSMGFLAHVSYVLLLFFFLLRGGLFVALELENGLSLLTWEIGRWKKIEKRRIHCRYRRGGHLDFVLLFNIPTVLLRVLRMKRNLGDLCSQSLLQSLEL